MPVGGYKAGQKIQKYVDDTNNIGGIHDVPIFGTAVSTDSVEAHNVRDRHEEVQEGDDHDCIPVESTSIFPTIISTFSLYSESQGQLSFDSRTSTCCRDVSPIGKVISRASFFQRQ